MVRIMDYEKKYKEALELARVAAFNGHQSLMEGIFPELAESEDEKIRKEIIYHIKNCDDTIDEETEKRMLAWLEKQGKEDSSIQQAYEWGYTEGKRIERKHWVEKQKFSEDYNSIDPQFGKPIEQNHAWSEEDECYMSECIGAIATKDGWSFEEKRKTKHWLESLKQTIGWKPSDEQITVLELASKYERVFTPKQIDILIDLKEQLKKLRGE